MKAQKAELFYTKAEEDLMSLAKELQNIKDQSGAIASKADELENRVNSLILPSV